MSARIQTVVVVVAMVLLYFTAAFMGRLTLMLPLVFLPLVLFLLARRDNLFVLVCLLYYTTLRVPMMAGQLELYHVAVLIYIVAALGASAVDKRSAGLNLPVVSAFCFAGVIVYTMLLRGSGFRLLGSGLWGGFRYVAILLGLGLFLMSDSIRLSLRQWRIALVGMVAAGALPAFAELLYVFSGGATTFLYYILQPIGRIGTAMHRLESGGLVRFTMMLQVSHIYLIPFFLGKLYRRLRMRYLLLPLLAMILGGLSGHRMVLLSIVLYIWTYGFMLTRSRIAYLLLSGVLLSSALLILGQMAVFFPFAIQRMLSSIPFANVTMAAEIDANSTLTWRWQLWKETISLIPKYIWLGKGFAYSVELSLAQDVRMWSNFQLWWAKVQTAYHQGILSLLVGLGLPGLLSGGVFLLSLCHRHYRVWRDQRLDATFAPMHFGVLVLLMVETAIYFLVYGDVFISFPYICLIGAIAEGVYRSGAFAKKEEIVEAHP